LLEARGKNTVKEKENGKNDKPIIEVPELRRLKISWNKDTPNVESMETVYVVLDDPEKEKLVFYLLDETTDGDKGFRGPFHGVIFPKRIGPDSPILKELKDMDRHKSRMDAVALLLSTYGL
jgi:hypothetical protein